METTANAPKLPGKKWHGFIAIATGLCYSNRTNDCRPFCQPGVPERIIAYINYHMVDVTFS
jgi:hypothetical protein